MVHEWVLAESILDYLKQKGYSRVRTLKIKLGVLQSIDKEILEFGLRELATERNMNIDNIVFEEEPAVLQCNTCGHRWSVGPEDFDDDSREAVHFVPEAVYAYTRCPRCGSRDFKILSGRGLSGIEVVE